MREVWNHWFTGTLWVPQSAANPAPVVQTGTPALPIGAAKFTQSAATDKSGTVTTGGTAQTIANANASRVYFAVQNRSSGYMYLRFGGAAAADQTSRELAPGDHYETPPHFCPTGLVSLLGATTGDLFFAEEA